MMKSTPIEILHKKTATKQELREALAEALSFDIPDFGNTKNKIETPFKSCLNYFLDAYKKQTGLDYSFDARDGKALAKIIVKINEISHLDTVNVFKYIINHLPKWYLENGFSLPMIDSKFNEIIANIKQQKNISDEYKKSIINDLK